MNKRKTLISKQNESSKGIKQTEKKTKKREDLIKCVALGRFFELVTTNKMFVNELNLHQIKSEILGEYTVDFELIRSALIGEVEQKRNIILGIKMLMIWKPIILL